LWGAVLAAGKGERLWPLTSNKPKALLPILCRPLIEWHLEILRESVASLTVVVGHMGEMVASALEPIRVSGLQLAYQNPPMGTGDAVKKALEQSEPDSEYAVILYSDVFVAPPLMRELLSKLIKERPAVLGVSVSDVSELGELVLDREGKLVAVREKTGESRPGVVNGGVMVLPLRELEEALSKLELSKRGEYELTDALSLISREVDVAVVKTDGERWIDVGTPWNYLEANRRALSFTCNGKEDCIVGERNIEKRGEAVIEGRAYVGGEVEIGPFSHLRGDNVLCGDNKIGFCTQVKSSVLLRGARAPHLNYIGDSVVGSAVNFGAGAVTANLRHDGMPVKSLLRGKMVSTGLRKLGAIVGDEAKIGINASLLPGVKIGYKSWVGSGCIIDRDIPDFTVVKCKQELRIGEIRLGAQRD